MDVCHLLITVGLINIALNSFLIISGLTEKRQDNISLDMLSIPASLEYMKLPYSSPGILGNFDPE